MSAPAPSLVEGGLPVGTLVIGDLHLDLGDGPGVERFIAWLQEQEETPHVVILGDLFEFWVGTEQADCPAGRELLSALRGKVEAGTAIDVIPGNRDFLLDEDFERASGCRVRHGGLLGEVSSGARVLFLHGDELSTLDRNYQRLRRVLRSAPVRWLARNTPTGLKRRFARRLRRASTSAVRNKAELEVAMQPDACREYCQAHGASLLVCGHAHRFQDEDLGDGRRWLVVDAFGGPRDTLVLGPGGELAPRR